MSVDLRQAPIAPDGYEPLYPDFLSQDWDEYRALTATLPLDIRTLVDGRRQFEVPLYETALRPDQPRVGLLVSRGLGSRVLYHLRVDQGSFGLQGTSGSTLDYPSFFGPHDIPNGFAEAYIDTTPERGASKHRFFKQTLCKEGDVRDPRGAMVCLRAVAAREVTAFLMLAVESALIKWHVANGREVVRTS